MIDLVEVESGNVPEEGPAGRQSSSGELLANARQKKGMKVEMVAERLKLSVSTIQALELGSMQGLPPRSFVQGYVRAYAKLVDLDVNVVLSLWEKEFPREVKETSAPTEPNNFRIKRMRRTLSKTSHARKRQKRNWIWGGAALGVVILFGILSTLDKPKLTSNHVLPQLPQQTAADSRSESHVIPILSKSPSK